MWVFLLLLGMHVYLLIFHDMVESPGEFLSMVEDRASWNTGSARAGS